MKPVVIIFTLTCIVLLFLYTAYALEQQRMSSTENNAAPTETPAKNARENSPTPTLESSYRNPFETLLLQNELTANQIIYPIIELGGCQDEKECYLYCSVPKNTPACWSYGTFMLHKEVLGVATASATSVKEITSCENDETCRLYCQANPADCAGYSTTGGSGTFPKNYLGPNGCRTNEECQMYCQAHPSACPGFPLPNTPSPSPSSQPTPYYQLPYASPLYETPVSESPDQAQ